MKKLTIGILASLACIACLSGCSDKGKTDTPPAIEASVGLQGAKAFLETKYKKQVSEVSANYELPNSVAYDGVTYDITWSVDVDKDVIVERDDDEEITYINVNESAAEDVKYTLIGTIKDADGNELKVEFKCKLLQGPTTAAVRITEDPVVGTAYKLYVYQGTNQSHRYLTGESKKGYDYYLLTSDVAEEGIDVYVEAAKDADGNDVDGKYYLYMNKVSGEGEDATTTKTYLNIVENGNYVNSLFQSEPKCEYVFDTEYQTIVTEVNGKKYYLGCDTTYDTVEAQYKREDSYYTAYLSSIVEKTKVTEDIKLETAYNTLTMPAAYVDEFDTALPTQDPTFTDVKINWSCESDKVTLGKNINDTQKANFKAGSTTDTVVLKASFTCGEKTATKEFSIVLVPNDGEAIAAAASDLKAGSSFGNEATLTGIVTKLDASGLAEYGNIEVTMAANGDITTPIGCYHLVGITDYQAKDVGLGYTITVKGILTNYNGTIQFGDGCEIVSFVEGTEDDIPAAPTLTPAQIVDAAYALEAGQAMAVPYTLTGVITEIDEAYSSSYKNITVIIAVEGKEDKPIMCYHMKGTGADVIKVGDTITVTGTLKNYNGTIEFDTGCSLDSYVASEGGEVTPPAGGEEDGGEENVSTGATLSFSDSANRTSFSTTSQVWEANGVKLTNNKGGYNNDLGDYTNPLRIYANTETIIEYTGMTKIVFEVNTGKPVANLTDSLSGIEGITVTTNGSTVTVEFAEAVNNFTITAAAQFRLNSIVVYA